jgi:response regulator of citrate/malate metabolism
MHISAAKEHYGLDLTEISQIRIYFKHFSHLHSAAGLDNMIEFVRVCSQRYLSSGMAERDVNWIGC